MSNLRQQQYFELNSYLSSLSNHSIQKILKTSQFTKGWGINHCLEFNKQPVFIKRIPVTDLEYKHAFSTKNLFQLPNYYHYGIGSAGFGAFRELLSHIKITNWVLNEETSSFPILYYYRIIKSKAPWKKRSEENLKKYLKYWNNSKRIETYLRQRMDASYEIALFLEYFPSTLHQWFETHPEKNMIKLIRQSQDGLIFLKQKGILHMDAHFANILTDGHSAYISDFGLALDQGFEFSKSERLFFDHHQDYDLGHFISCCGLLLHQHVAALPSKKQQQLHNDLGIDEQMLWRKKIQIYLKNIEKIQNIESLKLNHQYFNYLTHNQDIILFMNRFYDQLRNNPKKNTVLDTKQLKELLQYAGYE